MINMFINYGDLVSTFWGVWVSQTQQICDSGLNKPETKTKKTKERHKAEGETKVAGVRWLGEEYQKSFHQRQ